MGTLGTASVAAGAQDLGTCTPGGTHFVNYGIDSLKNAAFTAVAKTTFEQKLLDGNSIHIVSHARQARDSAGRTVTEVEQGCEMGADGQMRPRMNVNVYDSATRTSMSWQTGNPVLQKLVTVFHQPEIVPRPPQPPTPEEKVRMEQMRQASLQASREGRHVEQLGMKTINGITAKGTRTTRTIPAGKEGNELPLVVVDEMWRSQDMGLTLLAITDDPRRGKTTFEYEELNPGEPDPAVFTPPADYKVREIHPDVQGQ